MGEPTWKIVGASVAGFSHLAEGAGCQDAHAFATPDGGWLIAVVSDGAGSASRSAEGSRAICDVAVAGLADEVARLGGATPIDHGVALAWARSAIERTRGQLAERSADGSLDCFHATVVGVVAGPAGGCIFHVGDGSAFAADAVDLTRAVAISLPENGEHADDTYFFTAPGWQDHLRITLFPRECDLIALMTDGVTPFALGPGALAPHAPFFAPVSKYLLSHAAEEGSAALAATLSKEEIRRITGDDKTLVWAVRQGGVP